MGLREEIEETEARLARLEKELTWPVKERRRTRSILGDIRDCQDSISSGKLWLARMSQ